MKFRIKNYSLFILIILISSCKKNLSNKKLDGDWVVSYIEGTFEVENEFVSRVNYDGKNYVVTDSSGKVTSTEVTMDYTFDAKKGTYKYISHAVSSGSSDDVKYYFSDGNGGFSYQGMLHKLWKKHTVESEENNYLITGGVGDIEKNSQLILFYLQLTVTEEYDYEYYLGDTLLTSLIGYYSNKYGDSLESSFKQEGTIISSGENYGQKFNLQSAKNDEMIFNYERLNGQFTKYKGKYIFKRK